MSLKRQIGRKPRRLKEYASLLGALAAEPPKRPKFVLLQGIEWDNRFYSMYDGSPDEEVVKTADGKVSYYLLGFADTPDEARRKLYNRPC